MRKTRRRSRQGTTYYPSQQQAPLTQFGQWPMPRRPRH